MMAAPSEVDIGVYCAASLCGLMAHAGRLIVRCQSLGGYRFRRRT